MWTEWKNSNHYLYRHNGKTVQVKVRDGDGYIKASATCSPYDCFNEHLGLTIAIYRVQKKVIDKRIEELVKYNDKYDKWELAGDICLSYGESATVYSLNKENEVWVKAKYNGKWYRAVAKATNKIDGQNGLFRVAMLRLRSQLYAAAADKMEGEE